MENTSYKTPVLRFPEFKESWKQVRLNQLLYESKKRNYDLKFDKSQVLSVSGELGVVNQIKHLGRSYAGESVHNYHILQTGDIVYTKSPLKENPYGIIKLNKGEPGIVSTLYAVYKVNNETAIGTFLEFYFSLHANTNRYLRPLVKKGAKNDMKINNTYVLNDPIYVPQKVEQQKIANFLTAIDTKILYLARKKELLRKYKKGVSQQIFNRQIRFKDDNGNIFPLWEDKRLADIATFIRGKGLAKADLSDIGVNPCIHYGELFTKYAEVIITVSSRTDVNDGIKSLKGDILMPSSDVTPQGLGKASSIQVSNVLLGGDINIVRPAPSVDSIFLSYLLNYNKNSIIKLVTGTSVKHIYISDIKSILLNIPNSIKEQEKIADFLTGINTKIDLVTQQLQKAQQFKKGLLQKMFV